MPGTPPAFADARPPDPVPLDAWIGAPAARAAALACVARAVHREELRRLGSGMSGIVITGLNGSGKTTLAGLITTALLDALRGTDVQVLTVPATATAAQFAELGRHLADRSRDPGSFTLVLLDELSALAARSLPAQSAAAETLPALLAAMDGLGSGGEAATTNVLWIGMSAAPHRSLSPALTRSGRLGVHIELSTCDQASRVALIAHALRLAPQAADVPAAIVRVARRLGDGTVAADCVELGREAIALAYARQGAGAVVGGQDVRDALLSAFRVVEREPEVDTDRAALHEACHWEAAVALGRTPTVALLEHGGGRTEIEERALTARDAFDLAVIAAAGAEGERLFLGGDVSLGCWRDFGTVGRLASALAAAGEMPGCAPEPVSGPEGRGVPRDAQAALVAQARARAREILARAGEERIRGLARSIAAGELIAEDVEPAGDGRRRRGRRSRFDQAEA